MKTEIKKICAFLEKKYKVRILFAVENGSKAWWMASKHSDYDVRFVFVRPLEEYIQINSPSDVINAFFDDKGKETNTENALIDFSGFDIFKYVKMLSSSNPTTIEWLITDIVYFGKQNRVFRNFAMSNFNKISLYHHYKSMCRNNYIKYLKSGNLVTYKKYLYAYRGLINAKWVAYKKTIPPMIFAEALKWMKGVIPRPILIKLMEIIELKSSGEEKDILQNIVEMDDYIEGFLKDDSEAPSEKTHVTLNKLN